MNNLPKKKGAAEELAVIRETRSLLVQNCATAGSNIYVAIVTAANEAQACRKNDPSAIVQMDVVRKAAINWLRKNFPENWRAEPHNKIEFFLKILDWYVATCGERYSFDALRLDLFSAQSARIKQHLEVTVFLEEIDAECAGRLTCIQKLAQLKDVQITMFLFAAERLAKDRSGELDVTTEWLREAARTLAAKGVVNSRLALFVPFTILGWYEERYGPRLGFECFAEDLSEASRLLSENPSIRRQGCAPSLIFVVAVTLAMMAWIIGWKLRQ